MARRPTLTRTQASQSTGCLDISGAIVKLKIPVKGPVWRAGRSRPLLHRGHQRMLNLHRCNAQIRPFTTLEATPVRTTGRPGQVLARSGRAPRSSAIWEINKEDTSRTERSVTKGEYSTEAAQRYKPGWRTHDRPARDRRRETLGLRHGHSDAGGNWSFYLQENATVAITFSRRSPSL